MRYVDIRTADIVALGGTALVIWAFFTAVFATFRIRNAATIAAPLSWLSAWGLIQLLQVLHP